MTLNWKNIDIIVKGSEYDLAILYIAMLSKKEKNGINRGPNVPPPGSLFLPVSARRHDKSPDPAAFGVGNRALGFPGPKMIQSGIV